MKSIMYHYVQNFNKEFKNLNTLSFQNFKKQISYFKRNFYFFDVHKIFQLSCLNKNNIFLTFDDGLKCHYNVAKYLNDQKLNAIFFIPSLDFKNRTILNVHKIHIILATQKPELVLDKLKKLGIEKYINKKNIKMFKNKLYKNQNNLSKYLIVKKILNFYLDKEKQNKFVADIFYSFFNREKEKKMFSNFYLSKNEIKKMIKMNMLIGGHSNSHRLLTLLQKEEIKNEINSTKKFLFELGLKKHIFSYPYGGKKSYNKITIKLLKFFNFKFSFCVNSRDITKKDLVKKFHLPRYNCNEFIYGKVNKHSYN